MRTSIMKFFATAIALTSLVPQITSLTINTPTSVVVCEPILFTWTGGAPPYYLSLLPGGQVSGSAIRNFDTQSGNQFTWVVDLPSGSSVTVSLKDSTGLQAYSDAVSIQGGSAGADCLHGSGGSNSSPTSSASPSDTPPAATDSTTSEAASASASIPAGTPATTVPAPHTSASAVSAAQPAATHATVSAANSVAHPTGSGAAPSASHSATNAGSRSSSEFYVFAGAVGLAGVLF